MYGLRDRLGSGRLRCGVRLPLKSLRLGRGRDLQRRREFHGSLDRLLSEMSGRCGYRYWRLGRLGRDWHRGLLRGLLLTRCLLLLCCRCCGRLERRLGGGGRCHRCGLGRSCLLLSLSSGRARGCRRYRTRLGPGYLTCWLRSWLRCRLGCWLRRGQNAGCRSKTLLRWLL